jgi:hypothetical protein
MEDLNQKFSASGFPTAPYSQKKAAPPLRLRIIFLSTSALNATNLYPFTGFSLYFSAFA